MQGHEAIDWQGRTFGQRVQDQAPHVHHEGGRRLYTGCHEDGDPEAHVIHSRAWGVHATV